MKKGRTLESRRLVPIIPVAKARIWTSGWVAGRWCGTRCERWWEDGSPKAPPASAVSAPQEKATLEATVFPLLSGN